MVRARSNRPTRRNKNAGPSRSRKAPDPLPDVVPPLDETKYPNLAAQREMDHQERVRRGREMGLTRAQASQHAQHEDTP